ncbi:MAG TPA: Asp-tRNA(Asn)/Glu-tRNA(Gln) amidotransferase GatCAB subunit B, partial [Actinomycetota bacterium]|nr:Asp-tRNA(Asn)/Glu-tRNA(Gln) amidotransferase GatCAB subunit B [Actinomycetota bacterium]
SLRCDANISTRRMGEEGFGTKVEIKNLNSVRSLERALGFEEERQRTALERGETLIQETRHFDEERGTTHTLRSKEEAFDYRYFPEPDLPPLAPQPAWVEEIRASLPELPATRRERLEARYGVRSEQAALIGADRHLTEYFERAVAVGAPIGGTAVFLSQDSAAYVNRTGTGWDGFAEVFPPGSMADLLRRRERGELSSSAAKQVFEAVVETGRSIDQVIDQQGLRQVSDAGQLEVWVEEVIAENPGPVEQFRGGKEGILGFLVGQVMQRSGGSANPKLVNELLRKRLSG